MDREIVETLLKGENLTEFARSIDRLRYITRYATAPRSGKESVAEHSFFVAAYVLKLAEYYDFDVLKALSLALMHDYSESYISDVPHPIKARNPRLAEELEEAENRIIKTNLSEEMAKMIAEFNKAEGPEALVVLLADVMSVVSYAKYEMELGNSSYMKQVYENTQTRYYKICEWLKNYKKSNAPAVESLIDDIFSMRIENY